MQITSTFLVLYGLIVVQITGAFLVLWFDCGASDKCVLSFTVCTVVQVTSAFLFLWFDFGASHKGVLGFMVGLLR